ncbi:MAG: AAA family ATPase, partial [Gammaproteobacteria bacterium]|nr:AAA family ATPase [Gammaproteobacteria bacterium]
MSTQSPIATGGGGDQFEQHVAAFALGLLLVRATPPILTDTSVVGVHFQTRHLGWCTDDILLVGETSDRNAKKLALQVKRTFTVSAKDDDCCKTIQGMWDDFRASRFDCAKDHLAIVTLHGTSTLLRDFSSLLLCARATAGAEDFRHRLSHEGYLSKQAKKQDEAIQTILDDHAGAPVDAELYWRFLRVISVLSFDLNTSTSLTEAMMVSLLSHYVDDSTNPLIAAKNTWSNLLDSAGEGRPMAKSYKREDLPSELLKQYATVSPTDGQGLTTLFEHGCTVLDNIRSNIRQDYKIDRFSYVLTLFNQLAEHRIVLISGTAGSRKSVLAKNFVAQLEAKHPVLAFQAVEFATAHIDETLANAQTTLNEKRLFALLAGHDKVLVLIDGVERLLEHSVRDAFSHLLRIVKKNCSIQIVLTVRDYSQGTVRNALLEPAGLTYSVFDVPTLSDKELDQIQVEVPYLALPLQNSQLRSFFRTPYLLDMASRLDWSRTLPESTQEFREKCWRELIRADHLTAGGMPLRREKAFLDIAYRRATKLCSFVKPEISDSGAFSALLNDSLIKCSPDSSALFATSHDVLEDWAILQWLDEQFAISDDPVPEFANSLGGYPAIRRGFRKWLRDKCEINPVETRDFVLDAIGREDLPSYFRDDCLVSILLTDAAKHFLPKCHSRIINGNSHLLVQIIHMLRVACKKPPPWLDVPGLPSQMLVPTGAGWAPTLKLVSDLVENLLPDQASLLLGFTEDWITLIDINNPTPDGFGDAGIIVDALLPVFEESRFDDSWKRLLKVLIKIPRSSSKIEHLFNRAQTCNFEDRMASEFAQLILGDPLSAYVCRDFPAETIALFNARLRISEENLEQESRYPSSDTDVDVYFGIHRHGIHNSYPASALKGPFSALLQSHPQDALVFIIDFLNHAGNWYGNRIWPRHRSSLEPAV